MSVFFKQPSMKAWALFKSSVSFALHHPIFSSIFVLITASIACIQQLFFVAGVAARPVYEGESDTLRTAMLNTVSIFKVPQEYQEVLSTSAGIGMLWVARVVLMLFTFTLVFYVQSLLRHKNTSFLSEIEDSFAALIKAPWVIVFLFLQSMTLFSLPSVMSHAWIYGGLTVMSMMISLPLCYAAQLVYDHHYHFGTVARMSWNYFKESWFVILKYVILSGFCVVMLSMASYFFIWYSPALSPEKIVAFQMVGGFMVGLISHIAINKIYYQLRLFKHS